jgi:hypothetical protein
MLTIVFVHVCCLFVFVCVAAVYCCWMFCRCGVFFFVVSSEFVRFCLCRKLWTFDVFDRSTNWIQLKIQKAEIGTGSSEINSHKESHCKQLIYHISSYIEIYIDDNIYNQYNSIHIYITSHSNKHEQFKNQVICNSFTPCRLLLKYCPLVVIEMLFKKMQMVKT